MNARKKVVRGTSVIQLATFNLIMKMVYRRFFKTKERRLNKIKGDIAHVMLVYAIGKLIKKRYGKMAKTRD